MSKRSTLVALFALFVFSLVASTAGAFPGLRTGVEIGVLGSRPWLNKDLVTGSSDQRMAYGLAGGFTLDLALPHGFALESGLRYFGDADGRDVDVLLDNGGGSTTRIQGKVTTRFHRIGLPIRLRAGLPMGKGLSVEAGLEPQYLVRALENDDVTVTNLLSGATAYARGRAAPSFVIFDTASNPDGDVTDMYQRWSVLVGAGLGWDFGLLGKTAAVRARWYEGLNDQTKSKDSRIFSRGGELALGFRW